MPAQQPDFPLRFKVDDFDIDGVLVFAEDLVRHSSRLRVEAVLDQRQRLQILFFPGRLAWAYGEIESL